MSDSLLKRTWRECNRIASQYATAVAREAAGRPDRLPRTLYDLAIARLRYDVGPRYFSLFEFANIPRSAWSDFVTDDPKFKKLLEDMSPTTVRDIAHDKALFHRHCIEQGLPAVPILALVGKSPARDYPNVRWIKDRDSFRAMISEAPASLFIKPVDGTFGEGAFAAFRIGNNIRFEGQETTPDALFDHLLLRLSEASGWLVQPRLRCHPALAGIMAPHGLGTIRAVTCMSDGTPRLLLAILKITVGSNMTDNFHHGTTGNLVAPIDLATGAVAAARGSTRTDWPMMTTVVKHPDTGHPILGTTVPGWSDVVALVLEAQASLPQLKSTGWDVAVTPEGPLLVETNAFYSVDIMQVAYRRGLKRELMMRLGVAAAAPPAVDLPSAAA